MLPEIPHSAEVRNVTETSTGVRNVMETIAIASYVEQMLAAEQQWIMNRLQWLFTSQSFLIAAFVGLIVSTPSPPEIDIVRTLNIALPVVGVLFCVSVCAAVFAAERVGSLLGNERARLSQSINQSSATQIPLIGTSKDLRDPKWTLTNGGTPTSIFAGRFSVALDSVAFLCKSLRLKAARLVSTV